MDNNKKTTKTTKTATKTATNTTAKTAAPPPRQSMWIVAAVVAVALIIYFVSGGSLSDLISPPPAASAATDGEIVVSVIDVKQGDSILIKSRDNAVLIDAGESAASAAVIEHLRASGVETLDYVVATHPHSDHIGGMAAVIKAFTVKNMLMPDVTANTRTFENLMKAAEDHAVNVVVPKPDERFTAGIITLDVLAPRSAEYSNLNNYSIVLRMPYGETAFLFTGDAEDLSEREMVESGVNLRANVLKAGHHGSRTASTNEFLDAVRPDLVAVSLGADNTYGHPHKEFMDRMNSRNLSPYRTDLEGTIVLITDGKEIKMQVKDGQ